MTPAEIKALRAQLELPQRKLASLLGVSLTTVARWETGRNRPAGLSKNVLEGIAAAIAVVKDDPVQLAVAKGLVTLGIGPLIYMVLVREAGRRVQKK
jgi:transcriptional regulator with XRE-family HTH domain